MAKKQRSIDMLRPPAYECNRANKYTTRAIQRYIQMTNKYMS